jgi:SNF2 family DNA or RNA helicase
MSVVSPDIKSGKTVFHVELGEGVVLGMESTGYVRVFFRQHGERQVPRTSLADALGWADRVVSGLKPATREDIERISLIVEGAELPLMDSSPALTSAKVDLLPHQIVLVHRVASNQPRRFLVADEVGLGKTIETALILRELASRGELQRALMVVPAGLVENWRHELNDVFSLDFEVFGSEGDVTDRKTNAFAKHNRIIASVDTLKRRPRVKRLLEAPRWDLVVFDEAHHLTAYRQGNKVSKTENFKLAEALRDHARDLLLLSATPHQGDHFRFWMLVRLLAPSLFTDPEDMVHNRHRLNAVVVRRTKADACAPDGSPLFARRMVHTEGFVLSPEEKKFYDALLDYLRDGYNLAEQQGGKGRALGFVMTIFQKIAASSFSAVRRTLSKRLLALTIHEGIERDELLDVNPRDRLFAEAREMIHEMNGIERNALGKAQVDQIFADVRVSILKRRKEKEDLEDVHAGGDVEAAGNEDAAASIVTVCLPEERRKIRDLLGQFPKIIETKVKILVDALGQLWAINPAEKVVIFTTYLGSVDSIKSAIEEFHPDKGVEVLKGGDHGSKTAAQKRFKRADGPRVLVCTAAGREGINLQFARVLINHDLSWNPMDMEQRAGRIHRYGQKHTAQVYNLVATDTIEGQIFLLLEEKLKAIAEALGKVDERGQVAEDLRSQVLGQLQERLSYDKLYQDAVLDPTLRRTKEELEVAMTNATVAREVVFELFQDLDRFNLGDYQKFDDGGKGMSRLLDVTRRLAAIHGGRLLEESPKNFRLELPGGDLKKFTTDRDLALKSEGLDLLGLEHTFVKSCLDKLAETIPENRGILAVFTALEGGSPAGLLAVWQVVVHSQGGGVVQRLVRLGVRHDGERDVLLERRLRGPWNEVLRPQEGDLPTLQASTLVRDAMPRLLHRELAHQGLLGEGATYASKLLALVVVGSSSV